MSARSRLCLTLLVALTAAGFPLACGSVEMARQERVREQGQPPYSECFLRAGGRLADELQDISFFAKYRRSGKPIANTASAHTKTYFVEEIRPGVERSARQEEWLLYVGAPFRLSLGRVTNRSGRRVVELDLTPEKVLGRRLPNSFVVYFRGSQLRQREQAMKCMNRLTGIDDVVR